MLFNKQTIFAILAMLATLGQTAELSQHRELSATEWTAATDYWCSYWIDYWRYWDLVLIPTIDGIDSENDDPTSCWSYSGNGIWY